MMPGTKARVLTRSVGRPNADCFQLAAAYFPFAKQGMQRTPEVAPPQVHVAIGLPNIMIRILGRVSRDEWAVPEKRSVPSSS